MSERDLPPTPLGPHGSLSRLRAQLAGPRGYRRIDALLSADDAEAAVAALSPNEVFELVHEVGFEDGQPLIELATPTQLQGCVDLDAWNKDQLEVAAVKPWLGALVEVGFEKLGQVWAHLDAELRALIMHRWATIYDVTLEEAPDDASEAPIYETPDRYFLLELHGDEDTQRLVQQVVEDLYRADPELARHTIMAARSEPPAELEESSYRWRSGRLADLGYVDFYDALELFRPLPADQVHVGEGSQDRPIDGDGATHLPLVVAEEVVGRGFLARTLATIDDAAEAARLEAALVVLVNKVLAAARAKPGQEEVVRRGALYATATLSLGLETVARGDLDRAHEALGSVGLGRLFRVGYTVGVQLARIAQQLAARAATAGAPAREVVAALCSPRPLLSRAADDPPAPGLRPLESAADIRHLGEILTALTMRIALVESLGVDLVAMGQAPEPRPELDDHLRTALARALVAPGDVSGAALTQAELAALRRGAFEGAHLTAAARRAGHAAIAGRLGAAGKNPATGPILSRLVDGWLDDLERLLGTLTEAEVDPRFVEGLIVEIRRS